MSLAFEKTPRMSLSCKLVPVRYREYENGLFSHSDHALCDETNKGCKVDLRRGLNG